MDRLLCLHIITCLLIWMSKATLTLKPKTKLWCNWRMRSNLFFDSITWTYKDAIYLSTESRLLTGRPNNRGSTLKGAGEVYFSKMSRPDLQTTQSYTQFLSEESLAKMYLYFSSIRLSTCRCERTWSGHCVWVRLYGLGALPSGKLFPVIRWLQFWNL